MLHSELKEWLRVRPNTGLPENFFQESVIVCTGEDPDELKRAINHVLPGEPSCFHEYRCYKAWKFKGVTIIISGIGSGCLEPLMYELLDHDVLGTKTPKRLVMIGTAGYLSDSGFGQVYVVEGAYPVGCAVSLPESELPVKPNFTGLEKVNLPRAEEISTDYYYACTPQNNNSRKNAARVLNQSMLDGLAKHWRAGRLISMESVQFYHFAQCYGQADTQYVALRGVANLADQFETQNDYSQQVLTDALQVAVGLLTGFSLPT